NAAEVERIERILSADDMQGRRTFTPGIDKAAAFIAEEFKKAGLKPVNGDSYYQEIQMVRTKLTSLTGDVNGAPLNAQNVVVLSQKPDLTVNQGSGYQKIVIGKDQKLFEVLTPLMSSNKNYFVVVDTSQSRMFGSLKRARPQAMVNETNIVLILANEEPSTFNVNLKQEVTELKLRNVVGTLPGKKRKDETVIFSGHYDHLGIGKANAEGDSIFNGANDDAAGTTATIMLAHYFSKKKDNERTLVFAAFTAEEVGGYGAQHFSKQFPPDKVMAMFNIEMIGTESKWGTNSAFITGYERSDMGKILEKNLAGSKFTFYPDPYVKQNLFYRSDNATLARLGVPAHTISTSRMEADTTAHNKTIDKYYHTQDDEIETLDMKNMAEIIKAIAISSATIISGKDTPTRVDKTKLN
ncbi:MAG: M28 family peptidase, partial [Chitinophagaceae bacterium]|nr:M28 family peptidase [Chitinophagaceae bacterium]